MTVVSVIVAWVSIPGWSQTVLSAAQMLIFPSLSLKMVITANNIHPEDVVITGLQLTANIS